MKQHPERIPDNLRGAVPMIVDEGRRIIRQSAHRAGQTASRVARGGRRLVGKTMQRTERLTRRNPWTSLGAAIGAGFLLGGVCTFLFYRIR